MIYLASRYTETTDLAMTKNYDAVMNAAHVLIECGHCVVSPILHCHEMSRRFHMHKDVEFWLPYNWKLMQASRTLWILDHGKWGKSAGITREIEQAKWLNYPISVVKIFKKDGPYGRYALRSFDYPHPALRPID